MAETENNVNELDDFILAEVGSLCIVDETDNDHSSTSNTSMIYSLGQAIDQTRENLDKLSNKERAKVLKIIAAFYGYNLHSIYSDHTVTYHTQPKKKKVSNPPTPSDNPRVTEINRATKEAHKELAAAQEQDRAPIYEKIQLLIQEKKSITCPLTDQL